MWQYWSDPFSVSRHHLLYSSIPQEVPLHFPLNMVQHFMNHATKQQFFCFIRSKQGSKRSYHFWFSRVGATTLSTVCTPVRQNTYRSSCFSFLMWDWVLLFKDYPQILNKAVKALQGQYHQFICHDCQGRARLYLKWLLIRLKCNQWHIHNTSFFS